MFKSQNVKIWTHISLGLIAIVGYSYGGIFFRFAMIPYVSWMVIQKSSNYLPALCLHLITETMVMNVMYIAIAITCILNYKVIIKYKVKWLFFLLLLITPLFIIFWGLLFFKYKISFNESLVRLDFFLPLFAFFYGVLIAKDLSKNVIHAIFAIMFIIYGISTAGLANVRLVFFGLPLWCAATTLFFTKVKQNKIFSVLPLIFLIFYMLTIGKSTFTVLLIILFSMIYCLLYFKNSSIISSPIFAISHFIFIIVAMSWGISTYEESDFTEVDQEEKITFTSSESFTERFKFKVLGDRAPYWAAGLAQIVENPYLLPPKEVKEFAAVLNGKEQMEESFGAHNFYIDAVRKFGLLGGLTIVFMFVSYMFKSVLLFRVKNVDPLLIIIVSTVFADGIIGSLTGHFPVQPSFALISLGFFGISYAIGVRLKNNWRDEKK